MHAFLKDIFTSFKYNKSGFVNTGVFLVLLQLRKNGVAVYDLIYGYVGLFLRL